VEQPPADRAEDPLPKEERQPDREQERREDPGPDRQADEARDSLDLVRDLLELRLGQLDVGLDEAPAGVARRADLGTQARWLGWRRRRG
jgi:hypothetical protein